MRLLDQHFLWPDGAKCADLAAGVRAALMAAPANRELWLDPRMDWDNFIARVSFEWGIHPIMALVALQRERSLLTQVADQRDFDFATGMVGQDLPGTAHPGWNGLPLQIFLAVRTFAWLGGVGARSNFGYRIGLWPADDRFNPLVDNQVKLYNDQHELAKVFVTRSQVEYVQLKYTPHEEVLDTNGEIYQARIAPFFN